VVNNKKEYGALICPYSLTLKQEGDKVAKLCRYDDEPY